MFWIINAAFWGIHVAVKVLGHFFQHSIFHYFSNFPLLPLDYANDLFFATRRYAHFHSIDFFNPNYGSYLMYPAPGGVLYKLLYMTHYPKIAFYGGMVVFFAMLGWAVFRAIVLQGTKKATAALYVGSAVVLCFPVCYGYLLGNMEIYVFLLVAFGALAFARERYYLAALLIGVAASIKIFPAIFLAFLLSRKKFRETAFSIVTAIVVNIVSLWLICPSIPVAYRGIQTGLAVFREFWMRRYNAFDTGNDDSIFGVYKRIAHMAGVDIVPNWTLTAYMAVGGLLALIFYFWVIRRLPLLNQLTLLWSIFVLLPAPSYEYRMMHMLLPWAFLSVYAVAMSRQKIQVRGLTGAFVCFGILFSPLSYVLFSHSGVSGQVKVVVLSVLMVIATRNRWELPASMSSSHADEPAIA